MKESDNVIIELISARNDTVVTQVFIENKGISPSEIIKKLNKIMIKEWSTSGNLAINGEKIDLDKEINESVRIVMLKRLTYDPKELRRMRFKKRLRMRDDK